MLMQVGPLAFEVHPFNIHEYEHTTAAEYARKDVAGIRPPREFVGEDDEQLVLYGRLFPHKIGGLSECDAFDALRREGIPHLVMRGDGVVMGWFSIEQFRRGHTYLASDGVGQVIEFEATLMRGDQPRADTYFASLLRIIN